MDDYLPERQQYIVKMTKEKEISAWIDDRVTAFIWDMVMVDHLYPHAVEARLRAALNEAHERGRLATKETQGD